MLIQVFPTVVEKETLSAGSSFTLTFLQCKKKLFLSFFASLFLFKEQTSAVFTEPTQNPANLKLNGLQKVFASHFLNLFVLTKREKRFKVSTNNTLPQYPRPQFVRPPSSWKNLNGLWEFQFASPNQQPLFNTKLNQTILVPFPVESCLSGVQQTGMHLFYRLLIPFPFPNAPSSSRTLLHFGAVDWQTTVYVNGVNATSHTGGYSSFSADITSLLHTNSQNEIFLSVFVPPNFLLPPFLPSSLTSSFPSFSLTSSFPSSPFFLLSY